MNKTNTHSPQHTNALMFTNGINHPDFYLWDSWSFADGDTWHLYCLALARKSKDGSAINASERNHYPFHVRHFISRDQGKSWQDCGEFQTPRLESRFFDSRNVWSGSIEKLNNGTVLVGYTGLREYDAQHPFIQAIGLAESTDGFSISYSPTEPISCPIRDYQAITQAGYYLDSPAKLGAAEGEEGGPILAWRDPFIFIEADTTHLFWAAKTAPNLAAIAHAEVVRKQDEWRLTTLHPPIVLHDQDEYTQLEVPKIYRLPKSGKLLLVTATCKRLSEDQSDFEVNKQVRFYCADNIRGTWRTVSVSSDPAGSLAYTFGLSVLHIDEDDTLHCVAPLCEIAPMEQRLSLSPTFQLKVMNPSEYKL